MSYNIPTSTDFLTQLSDRNNFRYYRLKINDVEIDLKQSNLSLSGGQKKGYAQWSVTLNNNDNSITEGDYAEEKVTIEAKVGTSEYINIFTGFVNETGATKVRGGIGSNKIKLTFHDRQKSKGIKTKPNKAILTNYKINDLSSPSSSILYYLAGITGTTTLDGGDLDYTVPVVEIGDSSAWNELKKIAELYKADMYFRYDGALRFYSPFESLYTSPDVEWTFIADSTIVPGITESGVRGNISKSNEAVSCNKCKIEYTEYDILSEQVIYFSTENYNVNTKQCSIEIAPESYYPGDTSGDFASLEFKHPESGVKIEIATDVQTPTIGTTGSGSDIEYTSGSLQIVSFNGSTSATNQNADSAEIILYNSSIDTICEITKLTVRGKPHMNPKAITVEDIDPMVTETYQLVEQSIDGKYVSILEQAQTACSSSVEYGKYKRKKIKFSADWCPTLQNGVVINFKEADEEDQLYKVTTFTHKNKGSVFYTDIEAEEYINVASVSRPINKNVLIPSDIATKTSSDTLQVINDLPGIIEESIGEAVSYYRLLTTSQIIKVYPDGSIKPELVKFQSKIVSGLDTPTEYDGVFKIYIDDVLEYESTTPESELNWIGDSILPAENLYPSDSLLPIINFYSAEDEDVKEIIVRLYDETGVVLLDTAYLYMVKDSSFYDNKISQTISTEAPKYLGSFNQIMPTEYRRGDWFLLYGTTDTPLSRGLYKVATDLTFELLTSDMSENGMYYMTAMPDILSAVENGCGEMTTYGDISYIENLSTNSLLVNNLLGENAQFTGTVRGGTRFNADGTINDENVDGYILLPNGNLLANSVELSGTIAVDYEFVSAGVFRTDPFYPKKFFT